MTFTFTAQVAWDPNGKQAVKNASFQVYAVTDTAYTTPLPITDPFGVALPGNILNSGSQGVFPQFQQATNSAVVVTDPAHTYAWTLNCVPTDAATANFISTGGSATNNALANTYTPKWLANSAYTVNQIITNPTGDLVRCTTAHTATSTYDSTKFQLNATDPNASTAGALNATYTTPGSVSTQISSASTPLGLRTNLDTNPSFETNVTGLTPNGTGTTVGASTLQAYTGTQSALITWGTIYGNVTKTLTTIPGLTYTWSQYVYVPSGATAVQLTAYGSVPAQVYSPATTTTGAWQRLSVTFTANGTSVTLAVQGATQPPSGQTCYIDAGLIEQTAQLRSFFTGSTPATGATTYAWTGTADASTSTQTTVGAPWLPQHPAYIAAKAAGTYDPRLNVYNWKQSNTRKLRAALGKAMAGSSACKIGFAGDSTTAGYTALAATQSPPIVIRGLLEKFGYPIMGTGPVVGNPGGGPGGFLDGRWSFTGTWTTQASNNNFLYQTVVSGSTALFTSDKPGTIVELRYMNNGGAFTYSIDGAAAVAVTPTGAGTLASVLVTGLANTTHTINVTSTTATAFYLVWADVRAATSGVLIANYGTCSSTTSDWLNSNFYYPGNMLADWAPNCTFLDLGINDVGGSVATATIKANLQSLITKFQASGDVILLTSNPHQSLDFTAINQAKYELAISNDIPLIDIFDRLTSYAVSNPLGMYNDAAHPSAAGYADKGSVIFRAIA